MGIIQVDKQTHLLAIINQGCRKQFLVGGGGRGPKEQNYADSMQTYPQTGHLSSHRHSLGIFLAAILCDSQLI